MNDIMNSGMSRRNFVGAAAVATGAIAATAATANVAMADAEPAASGRKAILFDGSACVGCHYCEGACRNANGLGCAVSFNVSALSGTVFPKELLPYEAVKSSAALPPVTADDRTAERWLRVVQAAPADGVATQVRKSCMHCGLCAEVCPSGAIEWRDDGIVAVDSSRCFGCFYCYQACPFDVPRYPEKGEADRGMRKCSMCAATVDEGGIPACVDACPAGALRFGSFEELKAEGEAKVAALGGDAVLYGASELGGMSVMSVLPYGAKASGLPKL